MNPDKKRVGCLVPYCAAKKCNRIIKKKCALRRYFLIDYVERKKLMSEVETEAAKKEIRIFYERKSKAKKQTNKSKNKSA